MNKLKQLVDHIHGLSEVGGCELMQVEAQWLQSAVDEMREAADLIEQQQREIDEIKSNNEALKNAVRLCRQTSNARMLSVLSDDELKANAIIWRQVNNLFNQSPQASLAEVRVRQAEESYTAGFCEALNSYVDGLNQDAGMDALNHASEHTNKIRNEGE